MNSLKMSIDFCTWITHWACIRVYGPQGVLQVTDGTGLPGGNIKQSVLNSLRQALYKNCILVWDLGVGAKSWVHVLRHVNYSSWAKEHGGCGPVNSLIAHSQHYCIAASRALYPTLNPYILISIKSIHGEWQIREKITMDGSNVFCAASTSSPMNQHDLHRRVPSIALWCLCFQMHHLLL